MGKFMYKDQPYGGTTNYASAINCVDKDGNESTIQAEIDELNDKVDEQNKNLEIIDSNLESCFQSVSNGKSLVASAITDKGVITAQDATFEEMANNINAIHVGEYQYNSGISYSVGKGQTPSWTVTFDKPFSKTPLVCIYLPEISLMGMSVTTTGFTVSLYNGFSGTRSGTWSWIAMVS